MSGKKGLPIRSWYILGALVLLLGIAVTASGALAGKLTDTANTAHSRANAATSAGTTGDKVTSPNSTSLVISQIYGGAGCGTAGCSTYKNDYIELFNPTASSVSVISWSVQYAAAAGTSWQVTPFTATIPSGAYFLIAESFGANGVNPLPASDITGTIAMGATAGKVALVSSTTAMTGCGSSGARCWPTQTLTSLVDYIGYGTTATDYEGNVGPAPAPSTTTSDLRAGGGCQDLDDSAGDFTAVAPNPRNSSSPTNPCQPTPTPGGPTNTATRTPTLTFTATPPVSPGILTGFVTDDTSGAPIKASVQISGTGTFSQSNPLAGGVYTMTIAPGNYTMLLVASGCYIGQSVPVTITSGGTTHQDFAVERSGPDAAGYSCFENVGRSFVTASNRIMGPTFDEQVVDINGPMPFNYYGTSYLTGTVSSNGFITIGSRATNATFSNDCIPSTALPNGLIAANWDDLQNTTDPASGVYTQVTGSVGNRIFTVEWRNVKHFTDSTEPYTNTFELQLEEATGDIYMLYSQVNPTANGQEFTVGIENLTGTIGKEVQCSTSFTSLHNFMWAGNSIRFVKGTVPTPTPTFTPGGLTSTPTRTATNTRVPSNSVVISEFTTRGQDGGNDEFIELYNMSSAPIDISGWKINGSSNCGTATTTRVTISTTTVLNPHAHFLAVNTTAPGYSGSVPGDQTYGTGINDNGGIALLDDLGNLIDSAGMCVDTTYYEGSPLEPFTDNSNRSYERLPGGSAGSGQDTDNNAADFAVRENGDPQNLCSPAVGTEDATIGEYFFNPATITVTVGEAVRWTNLGGRAHTTTSGPCCTPDGLWNSGDISSGGGQYSHTFNTAGTFHYFCNIHLSLMEGDIVVLPLAGPNCAAPTNTPTATTTPTMTATTTVTPVLVVHMTWQGISQPSSRNTTETLTMTLRLTGGGPATEYTGYNTDANGNVTFPAGGLPPGNYIIRVKGSKNLSNGAGVCTSTVTLTGGLVTNYEAGSMRAGDALTTGAPNFNVVNSSDFTTLKNSFGKSFGQPGYCACADFNQSDNVDATDFSLQKGNFGQAGCGPNLAP